MNTFRNTAIGLGSITKTENQDKTYSTSLSACVDLFFQIGAIRGAPVDRIRLLFAAAYGENPDVATRIALYARDIRGGQGERRVFKEIIKYLDLHDHERVKRILHLIPEVGRWDDLFALLGNTRTRVEVLEFYKEALEQGNRLAAKWAPRSSSAKKDIAKLMMDHFDWSPHRYQKVITGLTRVVETQMCNREWGVINYEHVPSVASARYSKAFKRHDEERYTKYLEAVKKGEKKVNAGAVYPYDVTKASVDDAAADAMWNALPDYVPEGINFLPMVDVSGSMQNPVSPRSKVGCIDVSISLGIYLSERNKSAFNRLCLTFSQKPRFFEIPKAPIKQKVDFVKKSDNLMQNTNLDAGMQEILRVAQAGRIPEKEMPSHLLVLSDMEFDARQYDYIFVNGKAQYNPVDASVSERTSQLFQQAGYKMPVIVWWNIQSRHGNTPVRFNEKGMILVSGFSPSIMKSILSSDTDSITPERQMLATVNIDRYNH